MIISLGHIVAVRDTFRIFFLAKYTGAHRILIVYLLACHSRSRPRSDNYRSHATEGGKSPPRDILIVVLEY